MSYYAPGSALGDKLTRRSYILRGPSASNSALVNFVINDQNPENVLVRVTPSLALGGVSSGNSTSAVCIEVRLYNAFSSNSVYDTNAAAGGNLLTGNAVGSFVVLGWVTAMQGGGGANAMAYKFTPVPTFTARLMGGGVWSVQFFDLGLATPVQAGVSPANAFGNWVLSLDVRTGGALEFTN